MIKTPKKSNQQKVTELFERLAGDKLYKVSQRVLELQDQGKKPERAMADALFEFKCVVNEKAED